MSKYKVGDEIIITGPDEYIGVNDNEFINIFKDKRWTVLNVNKDEIIPGGYRYYINYNGWYVSERIMRFFKPKVNHLPEWF